MKVIVKNIYSTETTIDLDLEQIHKIGVKALKANKDNIVQGGYINLFLNDIYYPKCKFTVSPAKRLNIDVGLYNYTAWL